MTSTLKACGLFFVALAAVCVQLYDAQFVPGARCLCEGTTKFTSKNISDFKIIEKSPNCDHTEIILTMEEDNTRKCLNTEGKMGKAFLLCWNKINRDKSQKIKCIKRKNKGQ